MTLYVDNAPIYDNKVRYVPYELPFYRYFIRTPFGAGEINVNKSFMDIYKDNESPAFSGEHLAVAMTAWGNIRERFKLAEGLFGKRVVPAAYIAQREAFIAAMSFERRF